MTGKFRTSKVQKHTETKGEQIKKTSRIKCN